jgi:ferrous iron transport protein B
MTLMVSITLDKVKFKKEGKTFLALELPRYQMPDFRGTFKHAFSTTVDFVKDAGPVIFFTNSFVWALASFPNGPGNIKTSYLAELGQVLMPISSPIGLNWPETIAVLTSFLARETFVSTLATIYGAASDEASALSELISNNAELYTTASALSLMVFFAIALQCVSTLAVLRKELPQAKMVYTLFFGYLALAYIASFITYRLSLLLF